MSRVTKLIKTRRRKGSTHLCRMPRMRRRTFRFGIGTISVVGDDGTETKIGAIWDVELGVDWPRGSSR